MCAVCAAAMLIGAPTTARPTETVTLAKTLTNIGDSSEVGVARSSFAPTGDVFVTTAFVHVTFQFNISVFEQYCGVVRAAITSGHNVGAFDDNDVDLMLSEVNDACDGIFAWKDAGAAVGSRVKRQALAALGLVAGTLFGAFSIEKMQNLDARLRDLSDEVGDIESDGMKELHVVRNNQVRIGALEKDVVQLNSTMGNFLHAYADERKKTRSEAITRSVRNDVRRFSRRSLSLQRGMQALHGHRLSVDLVQTAQAEAVWPAVLSKVQSVGGVTFPFPHATVLYQLPVSFLMMEGVVRVFIHVPVIKRRLEFFQHRSTPIVLEENGRTLVLELADEEAGAMLAVDRDTTVFAVLSPPEVDECIRVDRAFFCEIRVLRRDFRKSCAGALFVNHHEGIQRHCRTKISDRTAFAFRIGKTAHLFSAEATSVAVACANGTRTSWTLTGHRRVLMDEGCQLTGSEFVIDGAVGDAEIDGGHVVHRIELEPVAWCDGASVEEVIEAQAQLREVKVAPARQIPALLQQLREHRRHRGHGEVHVVQHLVVAVLALAVCAAAAWLAWRVCTSARRRRGLFLALKTFVEEALTEADRQNGDSEVNRDTDGNAAV